jgi:hypothetical protein
MMSPLGTFRTWRDVRVGSAFTGKRKLDFGAVRAAFDPTETLAVHCATVLKPVSALSEYSF